MPSYLIQQQKDVKLTNIKQPHQNKDDYKIRLTDESDR